MVIEAPQHLAAKSFSAGSIKNPLKVFIKARLPRFQNQQHNQP